MSEPNTKLLKMPSFIGRLPALGIAQKMGLTFAVLLVIAAVNIVIVERMLHETDRVADTVNVAGKLRMLGQRIALQVVGHGQGLGAGEAEIRQSMRDFEMVLAALSDGGYVFGEFVVGLSTLHKNQLDSVREQWSAYRRAVHQTLDEIVRVREGDAALPRGSYVPRSNLNMLIEDLTVHSSTLLKDAESLMTGILHDVEAVKANAMRRMYVLLAVDILLLLLTFVVIRRQIVVPLRDLSTHCRELAAGNYNTRFQVSTQDEIGQLAKVFNESAWRIGSLVEKVEQDRSGLERAESMFRGIAENSMVGVYIAQKGRFRYVNAKMAEMFGYSRTEMVDNVASTIVFPYGEDGLGEQGQRERLDGDVPGLWMERKGRRKDGTLIEVEIFGSLMMLDNEAVTIGIAMDITRRKEAEAQAKLAMMVHRHSGEAMVVTDPVGRLLSVNPAFTRITGYEPEEVIGKRLNVLSSGRHDPSFYQAMWAQINATGQWEGDIWNHRKNGEIYAERLTINTCYDDDGAPRYRIGLFSDITKRKEADDFIWRQANHDYLTGLPNRKFFHERLEKEMQRSDINGRPLALVYLDLDDFKELNDSLGHGYGDRLLVELAGRLQGCIRATDTVARLGGDEFVLILSGLADLDVVDKICTQVMERIAEPFMIDEEQATVTASMGITFYPIDGHTVKDLLQFADLAMYAAKAKGKHQVARFVPSLQSHANMRRTLAKDLAVAVQENQFFLVYQPIVDLRTGSVDKVECLVRWQHPERGLVSPGVFIPYAEDSGMINQIGEWVFREASRQTAAWQEIHPGLQASINVSPVQFAGRHLSAPAWLEHLARVGLSSSHLVVEVTEGVLMDADEVVGHTLMAFRDAGVQVALDDFGTGYSSLSYLQRFDIDYLKIDQSFIRNLSPDSEDLVLCEAMIAMAHRLGLQVVAEGVETEEQCRLLVEAGCDFAQGYLFSRPVESAAFEALLRTGSMAVARSSNESATTGQFDH